MSTTNTEATLAWDLDPDRCDGLECPRCGEETMGFWVDPGPRDPGCRCDTCGHTLPLYGYLRLMGLGDGQIVGLALSAGASRTPAAA